MVRAICPIINPLARRTTEFPVATNKQDCRPNDKQQTGNERHARLLDNMRVDYHLFDKGLYLGQVDEIDHDLDHLQIYQIDHDLVHLQIDEIDHDLDYLQIR